MATVTAGIKYVPRAEVPELTDECLKDFALCACDQSVNSRLFISSCPAI